MSELVEIDKIYNNILEKFNEITTLEKSLHKLHMELKMLFKKYHKMKIKNKNNNSDNSDINMSDNIKVFLQINCKCKKIIPTIEFANKQIIRYIKQNKLIEDTHYFNPDNVLIDLLHLNTTHEKQSIFELPNLISIYFNN